ncbi:cytochrome c oxidase assembly factor 5 [Pararge aegeria]|uniref:Cytochrome c oxidase assembly factor 5 n=2 Tax=Pararge aegeria TaxID=116150 RepID=A0A8S4SP19_9NEOP|nr:cytochrome c oxidase assembly factor 5 [Pararge aegeria]XP_039754893.1 cytochrome c oxidase assembly factor 5 [Pararge aegeria]CAH2269003.1 jg16027 [Pararge aegeria aegeria]
MLTYSPEEVGLADSSPCAAIRADLKMCLLNSDCCKKDKKTPRDCLKDVNCPVECLQLRTTFFECKRSLLDARRRFRGNKGY